MKASSSTAPPSSTEAQTETLGFFSNFFALLGVSCFIYFTNIFAALHQFKEKDISFFGIALPGKAFNSEAALFTLTFMWLPLGLLHLLAHLYQRHSRVARNARPHFPYTLAKLPVIPPRYPWMKTALFAFLLVWPTFIYTFTTGRTFCHYGIIDWDRFPQTLPTKDVVAAKNQINEAKGKENQHAVTGLQLLTRLPATANGQSRSWKSAGWVWVNLARTDELRPRLGDPPDTTRFVATQALPLVQPWGFLIASIVFSLSMIWLLIGGFRSLPPPRKAVSRPSRRKK